MSLIDEALKRAREQTAPPDPGVAAPPLPAEDPWSYAPLPDRRAAGRGAGLFAAWAGAILLFGGAAWWLLRPGRSAAPGATTAPAERGAGTPQGSPRQPDPGRAAARGGPPEEAAVRGERPRPGGSATPVLISAGIASASPRIAPANRSRTLLPGDGQTAADRRGASPALRAHMGAFVAPDGTRIELGGIVFSDANPVALINGRVLPVGGVVGSMTVVAITENRVELAGEGARVFLSLR